MLKKCERTGCNNRFKARKGKKYCGEACRVSEWRKDSAGLRETIKTAIEAQVGDKKGLADLINVAVNVILEIKNGQKEPDYEQVLNTEPEKVIENQSDEEKLKKLKGLF